MFSALLIALALNSAQLTSDLQWRAIGPAITGGRIDDIAVDESHPDTVYIGAATGGVWKTVNGGTTWKPIFDDFGTTSIGDIAVSRSNPNIVWVGTGEANNRQSSSWGNGVYKSLDGGETWQHVGLEDSKHIGRIVIHPTNPDVVYVAALGHLWGPNKERGLFKTTDGGRTWTNTKFIDENTGFVDVAMDPRDPDTLYAAAYQRQRKAFGFNGGGPGSGLYKTTDAGKTWTRLVNGLPTGVVGRIGIDVYRKNPNVVYACYEHKEGGIFRSEDRGKTWKRMSALQPRPLYFSQIRIDPQNDQRIYMLATPLFVSDDGGRTFRSDGARNVHVDHHAMWIDPSNPSSIWLGNDGGVWWSHDRSQTWTRVNNIPLAQPYVVGFDARDPYFVYVGLQDNGVWAGPSATRHRTGPLNDDWIQVGGGDGMYVTAPADDSGTAYVEMQDGRVMRFDTRSDETKAIRPYERPVHRETHEGAGEEESIDALRFNWTTPLIISPHKPTTIYLAGHRLWRSLDRGEHWTAISDDLSRHLDRDTLPIMGVKPGADMLGRNDGVAAYGAATAMAESPKRPGLLLAGTDDGVVQMSNDAGATWRNLTAGFPDLPEGAWVSGVSMSAADDNRMYVSFDNHRNDDYRTYLYRTDDGGKSWRSATNGLPPTVVRSVREDPFSPDIVFAGTEQGLFWSSSRGEAWQPLKNHLPDVPVYDVEVHPRDHDLVVATHGRGVYIMNIAPLEAAVAPTDDTTRLLAPLPAVSYNVLEHRDFLGQSTYVGGNPPKSALIYYLAADPAPEATMTIAEPGGATVRTMKVSVTPGMHRVEWDLRLEPPPQPTRQKPPEGVIAADPRPAEGAAAKIPGDFGGGGDPTGGEAGAPPEPLRGPVVRPGTYRVTLHAAGFDSSVDLRVVGDPRVSLTSEEMDARWTMEKKIYEAQRRYVPPANRAIELRERVAGIVKKLNDTKDSPADVKAEADRTNKAVREAQGRLSRLVGQLGSLSRDVAGSTSVPTDAQQRQLSAIVEDIDGAVAAVEELASTRVAALARKVESR